MHCQSAPQATIALRYSDREVIVGNLLERPDPNLIDLCSEHIDRLTPPVGWRVLDQRVSSDVGEESLRNA